MMPSGIRKLLPGEQSMNILAASYIKYPLLLTLNVTIKDTLKQTTSKVNHCISKEMS